MIMIRGGMIGSLGGAGGSSDITQLDLSNGLAAFTQSFSGVTTLSITHGLGTENVVVEFKDSTKNLLVPNNWQVINPNRIDVDFGTPTQGDVLIIGSITSGIAPVQGGVSLVEGLSGIIDIDSPNNSIAISTSGQVIQLNALFTHTSGLYVDRHINERRWHGVVSGLELSVNTSNSGLFDITAGVAYVSGIRLEVPAQTGINPQFTPGSGDGLNDLFVNVGLDYTGNVYIQQGDFFLPGDLDQVLELGTIREQDPAGPLSGLVRAVGTTRYELYDRDYINSTWLHSAVGPLVSSGILVGDAGARQLSLSDGLFFDRYQKPKNHKANNPLQFYEIYRDSGGKYRLQGGLVTTVRNNVYDGGVGLLPMTGNRFAMHSLWFDIVEDRHYLVISNQQYDSLQLAQDAPMNAGSLVSIDLMPIAKIIIRRNESVFSGDTGRIIDQRPIIGSRSDSSSFITTATSLQQAYNNSTTPEILLDDINGALTIIDNQPSLGSFGLNLFEVINNTSTSTIFAVSVSGFHAISGFITNTLGIGPGASQSPTATLDVSGSIKASSLEIVSTRPTVSGIGVALLTELVALQSQKASVNFTPSLGAEFVVAHNLNTTDFTFNMWSTDTTPNVLMVPNNVYSSGVNHAVVSLDTPASGKIVFIGGFVSPQMQKATLLFTPASGTEFVMAHNLNTADFTFSLWNTDTTPNVLMTPTNIYPSGLDHVVVSLDVPCSGKLVLVG